MNANDAQHLINKFCREKDMWSGKRKYIEDISFYVDAGRNADTMAKV